MIIVAFALQLCFFAPLSAISNNIAEISASYNDIVIIYLILSLVLILLLTGLVRIKGGRVLLPLLAFLSTVAFIQSRFFLGLAKHTPFNGSLIDWQALQGLAWMELAAIAVLAILFFALRRRVQVLSTIALFILLFLTAGLLHQVTGNWDKLTPGRSSTEVDETYLQGFYKLSGERDVIHVVADQAQGAMLHDILSSRPQHYAEVFEGFTLFTQAAGQFKSTYPSVAFYMSGESPEPEYDLVPVLPYTWGYVTEVLEQKSIVNALARSGYTTYGFQFHSRVYCKGDYTACGGTHDEVFAGSMVMSSARRLLNAVTTGLDLGLFQSTPVIVRKHVFADGHWLLKRLHKSKPTHSGILDLFTSKVKRGGEASTYNYFHHAGAHAPLLFDSGCNYVGPQEVNQHNQREQVLCTLSQLEGMLATLKDRGLYDSSLIVINGDHGSPWLPEGYAYEPAGSVPGALMGSASALLMVKPPGAKGALQFSDYPASLGDIPATVSELLGLGVIYPGVALFGDARAKDRERFYYSYAQHWKTHHLQHLPEVARYRIRGNLFDGRSWVLPSTAGDTGYVSQLRMDDVDFTAYTTGFSWLEKHETPARWVNGERASATLRPPSEGPLALVLETYVPPTIEGQWMEVLVDEKVVARLNDAELRKQHNMITLPLDASTDDVIVVKFKMGKTYRPPHDARDLSVLFRYIGLVPAG